MKISILLMILFHIFYFFPFYFSENILAQEDLIYLTIPLKYEAALMWRKGIIPFWDEKISNGMPLLANPTSSSLYPFIFPFILFPTLKVYTFLSLLHHLFFIFGIFFFSNLILKNPYISLFFSNFLGYNGIILRFFVFTNPLFGISFLPWCLFFFYKFLEKNKKINLVISSFLFAFSILAGFDLAPLLFSFSILLLTLFVNLRKIHFAFFCIFLAFLLSAPQTIPTLKYLPLSQRGLESSYEESTGFFSLHPLRILDIFIPNFHGIQGSLQKDNSWADALCDNDNGLYPNIYFGIINILFLFSLRPVQKKWLLFLFTILFLLLSFGKYFPLHFYFSKLPVLSLIRYPEKFLVFLLLFLYLFFLFKLKKDNKISVFPSFLLMSFILTLILINRLINFNLFKNYISFTSFEPKEFEPHLMELFLLISFFISLFTFFFFLFFKNKKFFFYILSVFSFFDLYYGTYSVLIPNSPHSLFSPIAKEIKSAGNGRICYYVFYKEAKYYISKEYEQDFFIKSLSPHTGLLFGIPYAFSTLIDKMHPSRVLKIKKEDLDLWGVSHIITLGEKIIKGKEVVYFSKEFSVTLFNKNSTYLWFIREKDKFKTPLPPPKIKNPSKISITINNETNGVLWLGFNSLKGWKILVNGIEKKLSDDKLEGLNVSLEAGKNKVDFIYKPPGLFEGVILFFSGIIIILFFLKIKIRVKIFK